MPPKWKPTAASTRIFDALPTLAADTFLTDDEMVVKMNIGITRDALNAALGPATKAKVTHDDAGRYWRKTYMINRELRCVYFVPTVQGRARALEMYPDGTEPPFPKVAAAFQLKRRASAGPPRKPSKTTARSGEKRPTSARPRMHTTPGEKVTRVDPVDDAELLVPDEDVVDLDEVAPVPRPVTRQDLSALEQRAEDAFAARDHAEAARDAGVAAHEALRDRQDAVFARNAIDSARLMLLSLSREANALSAERAARQRDIDRLRAESSQEKELWKIDCERRAAARLDEERRRLEEGFRTNTSVLHRQLDAKKTECDGLKKKLAEADLELLGLRRFQRLNLESRVEFLPDAAPPGSDYEGASLWQEAHAVAAFLSRICGPVYTRKQQKVLMLISEHAWSKKDRGRGEIGIVAADFYHREYRRIQGIFSAGRLLEQMDVHLRGNYETSEAFRRLERTWLLDLGEELTSPYR